MTTTTLTGFSTTGSALTNGATLNIITSDAFSFSYKFDANPNAQWGSISITKTLGAAPSLVIGGTAVDLETQAAIGEITWSETVSGKAVERNALVLRITAGGTNYHFTMKGDTLPSFANLAAYNAFLATSGTSVSSDIANWAPNSKTMGPGRLLKPTSFEAVTGTTENDTIVGNDTLHDWSKKGLDTGLGNDNVTGTTHDDIIQLGRGNDSAQGGAGNDRIDGGSDIYKVNVVDADLIDGGAGDDTLSGGIDNDTLIGGDGNDRLLGQAGNDNLSGGLGNDFLDGGAGNDLISGGAGNDTASGGAGNDSITGEAGADKLSGGGGDDTLSGGADNDTLTGSVGNDSLTGETGDDDLNGGDGADHVDGGVGNDKVYGGGGTDNVLGGDGNDTVSGGSANDTLDGGAGDDKLNGDGGNDLISGGAGKDEANGGAGNDVISGGAANDILSGATGNDVLNGDEGDDQLIGGAGNDTLSGGAGNDKLTGGLNADVFVFEAALGDDRVTDFRNDVDTLRFSTALAADWEALEALGTQQGAHVVFEFGDDSLTVMNVKLAALANDVEFF